MWNDADTPLAYLITFRTYGTWLHGDKRGSVDRLHNQYKTPLIEPNENWQKYNFEQLKNNAVILSSQQRTTIESAVRETCDFRNWFLQAINVRTNHVHAVVSMARKNPKPRLTPLKPIRPEECASRDFGKARKVLGRVREVKDICGMKEAWRWRLSML